MVSTRLPAEIEFRLPAGWEPAGEPAPDGPFTALHVLSARSGFTANITVRAVNRADTDTLPEIAEETVARSRTRSPDLTVLDRGELADGFAQQLPFDTRRFPPPDSKPVWVPPNGVAMGPSGEENR